MQTFVPIPDMKLVGYYLDNKRLWKQCLESWELYRILAEGKESRWRNHPACLMWKGYEGALRIYIEYCRWEWQDIRGKNNNTIPRVEVPRISEVDRTMFPPWWGGSIHKTHRIALLTKNFEHYKQFGWEEKPDENYTYFWPVKKCVHCDGSGKVLMESDPELKCQICHGSGVVNQTL